MFAHNPFLLRRRFVERPGILRFRTLYVIRSGRFNVNPETLSLKNVRSRMNSGVSGFLKRVRLVRVSKRTYDPCFVPFR